MPAGEERKTTKRRSSDAPEAEVEGPQESKRVDTEEVDKLIDEIDEVLEENAEEFVRGFIQKGGQ
ncbi:MAG: ubiquitin-like protein Pup [Actinomycetota bacterium]